MLVKLDLFPKDRGENKKYLKPPPRFRFSFLHVGAKEKQVGCLPQTSAASLPRSYMCHGQKSLYWGGHHTFNRNPYNGYINPYYWVDDHPLLYGNNASLDPGTHGSATKPFVDETIVLEVQICH